MKRIAPTVAEYYISFWERLFRLVQRRTIVGFLMVLTVVITSITLGLAIAEHVMAAEALWRVIVYLMSGSDTVPPMTPAGKSFASVALVCGVLLQAIVTGYIAATFSRLFVSSQSIRVKPSWRVFQNHIIFLGWDPKRKAILSQLNAAWKDDPQPREIVIVSPDHHLDRGEEAIYNHVWHVRGGMTDTEVLREADLTPHRGAGAEFCIIMSKFKFSAEENDRRNLLQLFAVEHLHPEVYSLAEVQIESNHDLFESANADQIILPSDHVDLLFARTVEHRGTAAWFDELLALAPVDAGTDENERPPVSFQVLTAREARVSGKRLSDAAIDYHSRTNGIIAGTITEAGAVFLPDIEEREQLLGDTTNLIVIARADELTRRAS